jgi:4-amino-4-deoxy-L-arabinose transferase-like glycosyltransferase
MSRPRLVEGIFIGLIFVVALAANIYLLQHTPFWSDSSSNANFITQIAQSGEISSTEPYKLATPDSPFPLVYPQLYFVLVATLHQFIGPFALKLVPSISVAFLIVAIYILGKHLCGHRVGFVASLVVVPGVIFTRSIEAEMSLLLLVVLSLLGFHLALQTGRKRWLLLTGIFAAGAVGMKQEGWFAILLIVLATIIYAATETKVWRRRLRDGLIAIAVAVVLFFPVIFYQFSTTGYIVYIGTLPAPVAQVEEEVASWLGAERYEPNAAYTEYHSNSRAISQRKTRASPLGTVRFLNSFDNRSAGREFLEGFFVLFLVFGAVYVFRDRNKTVMALALSLAVVAVLYMTLIYARSYFLVMPLLAGVVFSYGLVRVGEGALLTRDGPRRVIQAALGLVVISGVSIGAVTAYQGSLDRSVDSMPKQREYREMGEWIDKELPQDAIILTPRQNELAQYAHRRVIWLNPVGGTELYDALNFGSDTQLASVMARDGVSYIFIDERWVGNPKWWISYVSRGAVEGLEASDSFERIFGTEMTDLYHLIRPGEQAEGQAT